jgi:hypothetical protein
LTPPAGPGLKNNHFLKSPQFVQSKSSARFIAGGECVSAPTEM